MYIILWLSCWFLKSILLDAANVNLGVSATPTSLLLEPGQQAEFDCDVTTSQSATITWSPQTPQTLIQGNRLILTNVTQSRDTGRYTCRATDESGYNEARVTVNVGESHFLGPANTVCSL